MSKRCPIGYVFDPQATMGMVVTGEVDLRVELNRAFYSVGEIVRGNVQVRTTRLVEFHSATLTWQSRTRIRAIDQEEQVTTVLSISQPILNLTERPLDGTISIPVEWEVPGQTPVTVEMGAVDGVAVETTLTATLVLGEPYKRSIVREYHIKIIQNPTKQKGILQSIEFPLRSGCCECFGAGIARAHIELPRTTFTAGDRLEATIVIDLLDAHSDIKGIIVLIRRTVQTRTKIGNPSDIDEYEIFPGPCSGQIASGTKTALTVATTIPELSFVPNVLSETINIYNAALFLFFCPCGWEAETEIPIQLVHPEALPMIE